MSSTSQLYGKVFGWAFNIGVKIKEKDDKLLRVLIFDVRGEETPGRFLAKLVNRISEYKTNRNISIDISVMSELFQEEFYGDSFHKLKASILAGLTNALSLESESNRVENEKRDK